MINEQEKKIFIQAIRSFVDGLSERLAANDKWNIKGIIDYHKNIYAISNDTKMVSKIFELQLFPLLAIFAENNGYDMEPAEKQNWYPDLTFIKKEDRKIKFAVDIKTTYRLEDNPDFCNGFTLGSHGKYFVDRDSRKNIQYPYKEYSAHLCLGVIYSRLKSALPGEKRIYSLDELEVIPALIGSFVFFVEEKWRIASDKSGSGNTANIGSIQYIPDIISGNGVFARAGEKLFDDYWVNYGIMKVSGADDRYKKLSTFEEYLACIGLSSELNNPKVRKMKGRKED